MSGHRKRTGFVIFVLLFSALFSLNAFAEKPAKEPAINSGKEIPDFEFNVMNTGETISKAQLSGKVYILDFWKTTCPKCQEKMGFLHDLSDEFGSEGLVIIALSLDKSIEEIEKFRKDKWAMPWIHVWVKDGWNDPVTKTFEVVRLPRMIIVGADHQIIGTNTELDDAAIREKIKAALDKHQ